MAADLKIVGSNIPAEMKDELQRRAAAADRSLAAEIRVALRAWLDQPADSAEAAA